MDGALLLKNDIADGVKVYDEKVHFPNRNGTGAELHQKNIIETKLRINKMIDLLKKITLISLFALTVGACQNSEKQNKSLIDSQDIIAEISKEYAPDKRVALFNVEAEENEGKLVLKGESNLPEAVNSLKLKLKEKQIAYTDSIQLLPNEAIKETQNALVKISVA